MRKFADDYVLPFIKGFGGALLGAYALIAVLEPLVLLFAR